MQLIQQAVSSDFATPSSDRALFLECLGERNHGFADLRVGKRGEPYQNTLNIAPPQNERIELSTSTPHAAARIAASFDFIPLTR